MVAPLIPAKRDAEKRLDSVARVSGEISCQGAETRAMKAP